MMGLFTSRVERRAKAKLKSLCRCRREQQGNDIQFFLVFSIISVLQYWYTDTRENHG